jgi:hypothetical protein
MTEMSPNFNKSQVIEVVTWNPAYEQAAQTVVKKFGEAYKVLSEWGKLREGPLVSALQGQSFDAVNFPAPGFNLLFLQLLKNGRMGFIGVSMILNL